MKEESEKTYTYYRKAQYHETDQMGIIHHSNYVKWMEEARIGYMSRMGFSYKKVVGSDLPCCGNFSCI